MHRKCLLQHLVWAGMQEMIIVTVTTISSFALGSQRSHCLHSGGVRPFLPLSGRGKPLSLERLRPTWARPQEVCGLAFLTWLPYLRIR